MAAYSFALDIPHVASLAGIAAEAAESSCIFFRKKGARARATRAIREGAGAGVAWRRAAGGRAVRRRVAGD